MQLIGILGGTFNPIHFGHLRMAQEITDALALSEVRFIPSANPPHKASPTVSAHNRAEMVQLAIADNPAFKLDTRELKRNGASYTIDTLISLNAEIDRNKTGKVAFCLIMGSDAFLAFNTWHRWREILDHCHIILVQRTIATHASLTDELKQFLEEHYTENVNDLRNQAAGFIHMQPITALNISSTAIRASFKQKQNARYLIPENVMDYIVAHQLYTE